MLIVLEGVDCSGKTTLADRLQEIYEAEGYVVNRWKRGIPYTDDGLEEYYWPLVNEYVNEPHTVTICDRWHIGDAVYGPLKRGYRRLTPGQTEYVDLVLDALGATKLCCTSYLETLRQRYEEKGETYIDLEQVEYVDDQFKQFCTRSREWTLLDPAMIDERTLLWIITMSASIGHTMGEWKTYVGTDEPDTLLVADRPGGVPDAVGQRALAPTTTSSCGYPLMNALVESSRYDYGTVGMINANSVDEDDVPELWRYLDQPTVVALGRKASRKLSEEWVPHVEVAHPQFTRRFKYDTMDSYVEKLLRGGS